MTELRVTHNGWAARLKLTAGALGIVDFYDEDGAWVHRTEWNPLVGFKGGQEFFWAPARDLNALLAYGVQSIVGKRFNKPRKEKRS
jgi:hypothetical protein